MGQSSQQVDTLSSFHTLIDILRKANDIMQNMVNYQVMTLAPAQMQGSYFEEVFESIRAQVTNKRLKLQLENEEFGLEWKDWRRNEQS
jgi:hypothetical protein